MTGIQIFRMRLMKYSFKILYVPGKELVTADTLSREPLDKQLSKEVERLNEDLNLYVSHILESFQGTQRILDELRLHQQNDEVCRKLFEFCIEGWPDKTKLNTPLRATITSQRDLLLKDQRIVIPSSLRLDILDKIHSGHQEIRKCRAGARNSVWWPGLSKKIEDTVTTCTTCCKQKRNHAEPMMPTTLTERPWQKIGVDLFHHGGKENIIADDYYSRFFEINLVRSLILA